MLRCSKNQCFTFYTTLKIEIFGPKTLEFYVFILSLIKLRNTSTRLKRYNKPSKEAEVILVLKLFKSLSDIIMLFFLFYAARACHSLCFPKGTHSLSPYYTCCMIIRSILLLFLFTLLNDRSKLMLSLLL